MLPANGTTPQYHTSLPYMTLNHIHTAYLSMIHIKHYVVLPGFDRHVHRAGGHQSFGET